MARRFVEDERGVVAAIFAIVFAAVLMTAAICIEFALGTSEQTREQQALDAAALAASDVLGLPGQDTDGAALAKAYFKENIGPRSNAVIEGVKLDAISGSVTASSHGTIVSGLMKVFGADSLRVGASTKVGKGDESLEIALVLDNSGSMAGSYIADLKTAAKNLTGILFAGAGTDKVKIGVVPFAASVNVGSMYRSASWMDSGSRSLEYQNVATSRSRFQLFDDMGVAWGGCVEVRPGAYASNDAAPNPSEPDSYFVPMLAPDEPDGENDGGESYSNSYLVDDAGACTPQPTTCTKVSSKSGKCLQWTKTPLTPIVAQTRTCKYKGQSPSGGAGPNQGCTTKPLMRMSTSQGSVDAQIDSMVASGNTNVGEGLAWGWRVVSPGEPFSDGRAYNTPKNKKIIILMTDGENTYNLASNQNKTGYSAYGYALPVLHPGSGRLGTTYTKAGIKSVMDANLLAACTNAKAAGVIIYTIGFRLENDPASLSLLKSCASETSKYFAASNGSILINTFQQIARQLNQLRVTG